MIAPPDNNMLDINTNRLSRWELIQKCYQSFWKRWQEEYLSRLQERPKWKQIIQEIQVGDLVLMKGEQTPPTQWPLGRVLEKHPGKDNLTRVVTIKIGNKTFKRDITKICRLPINEPVEEKHSEKVNQATVMHVQNRKRKITASSEAINKYTSSNIWKMKTKMTKMSLLLCTLMCCLWSAKGTISQSLYDIKPFHEPPGLYFEDLGPAQLINSNWNMMVYYNLETYNAELKGIENFVNILSNKCTAKNEETNFCDTVLGQLKHQFLECEHNDKLIFDQTMHSRSKRSYFNIIGNVAHGLFGLLDNEFAEKYEEDIAKLKINQNHAQELIKKQTSITDATINLFRNNTNSVLKEFMKFEDRMKIQNNKTSAKEEVIALATATIIHMVGLQRVQSQILDMLTTIHHGRVSTSLLTPVQLKSQLDLINQNLPQYLMVPEGNNLLVW